jgi:hypothetical protein
MVLSLYYLLRSIQICVQAAMPGRMWYEDSACDSGFNGFQLWVIILSVASSCATFGYKIGLLDALRCRRNERSDLKRQLAELTSSYLAQSPGLGNQGVSLSGPSAAGPSSTVDAVPTVAQPFAAATAPPANQAHAADGALGEAAPAPQPNLSSLAFVTSRNAPTSTAPSLATLAPALEAPSVRGVCDGCGREVLSTDEGRVREGAKYYHAQCVKGQCGGCGLVVHQAAYRERREGVYWHSECL